MHLPSLPAMVAAALPDAVTTIQITLDPRCHINVVDGAKLSTEDISRIDTAILHWRAALAGTAGILVSHLKTEVSLPVDITPETDTSWIGVERCLGRVSQLTITIGE